jgi:voltage-gated potassium channel
MLTKVPVFPRDLVTARRRLIIACSLLFGIAVVAVIGYLTIGGPSVTLLDAVYMAVITLSDLGYDEIVSTAHNPHLRLFNIFIVVIGVGLSLYVFSGLTAFLIEGELHHLFRRKRMKRQIDHLERHYIVCGGGETGRHVIEELGKTGTPHVLIDISSDAVSRLTKDQGGACEDLLYVVGDATDEGVLLQAGLDRAKGLIAALASDKDNLVITVVARQRNPAIRIVSRCTDLSYSDRMLKVGADSTVSPNRIGALRMASEMLRPTVVSFLDLMLQEKSRTLRVEEIALSNTSAWIGKKVADLELSARYDLLLLALKSAEDPGKPITFNPSSSTILSDETVMILLGDIGNLQRARADAGS